VATDAEGYEYYVQDLMRFDYNLAFSLGPTSGS